MMLVQSHSPHMRRVHRTLLPLVRHWWNGAHQQAVLVGEARESRRRTPRILRSNKHGSPDTQRLRYRTINWGIGVPSRILDLRSLLLHSGQPEAYDMSSSCCDFVVGVGSGGREPIRPRAADELATPRVSSRETKCILTRRAFGAPSSASSDDLRSSRWVSKHTHAPMWCTRAHIKHDLYVGVKAGLDMLGDSQSNSSHRSMANLRWRPRGRSRPIAAESGPLSRSCPLFQV